MPHRKDDHDVEYQYSDHEFQTIRTATVSASGDTGQEASDRAYEPLGGDLQNDEIAELVAVRGVLAVETDESPAASNQDQAGVIGGKSELGINLDGDERATSDNRDLNYGDEDSPAILMILHTGTATTSFLDSANSIGGGGGGAANDRDTWYPRQALGTGPFLDKADDVTLRTEVNAENTVTQTTASAYYQLVWRTYELESARPTFGFR